MKLVKATETKKVHALKIAEPLRFWYLIFSPEKNSED